jgi:hypothetical protein
MYFNDFPFSSILCNRWFYILGFHGIQSFACLMLYCVLGLQWDYLILRDVSSAISEMTSCSISDDIIVAGKKIEKIVSSHKF